MRFCADGCPTNVDLLSPNSLLQKAGGGVTMPRTSVVIDGKKLCSKCQKYLPVSAFSPDKKSKSGLLSACRRCANLSYHYGITHVEYENLLKAQHGSCAICGVKQDERSNRTDRSTWLSVDHDHATGRVRGLLCLNCNTAIAHLHDDIALAERAIAYLKKHQRATALRIAN